MRDRNDLRTRGANAKAALFEPRRSWRGSFRRTALFRDERGLADAAEAKQLALLDGYGPWLELNEYAECNRRRVG